MMIEKALALRNCGLSVLPIKADGSKKPALLEWKHLQEIVADDATITSWYQSSEEKGLGVIAGVISGGLEIIDIENPVTAQKWAALVSENGAEEIIKRVVIVKSPNGFHVYYRCEQPGPNTDLARRPATEDELRQNPQRKYYKLIETRGEGGYAIVPGSPANVHDSGRLYELKQHDFAHLPVISMDERNLLLECARQLNEYFKEYHEPTTTSGGTDRPGDLFNERVTWAEILEPLGWRSKHPGRWIRPGGTRDSAQEILDGSKFWAFSSSAGLPQEQALSKFAVYAFLNHGGNFAVASKELAAKGYCKPEATPVRLVANEPAPTADEEPEQDVPIWPTMPAEAFYGIAGRVAMVATAKSEADPAAVLATFLVRAGATFGAKSYFNVGETKHYPRLFSIVVGASSRARKGTSLDPVERIFDLAEKKAAALPLAVSPGPLSSGEGLIKAVRDPVEKEDGKKADEGVEDKRLLVVESEFGGTLRAMQREGSTLSAVIRTAWDRGNIAPLTKHNPIKTTGAHISILGHITRQELGALLEKVEVWNGLANRFLWFCARRSKLVAFPEPMDEQTVSDLASELADAIHRTHNYNRTINFHPDVAACWKEIYSQLTEEVEGIAGSVTSRAEAQVIRLSLVFALLDRDDMIRMPHLMAALAVWQYCFASVKFIFAPGMATQESPENSLSNRILDALKDGEKTQKDLHDHFHRHISATKLTAALNDLQAVGRISQRIGETGGKGGRKPIYWSLAIGGAD